MSALPADDPRSLQNQQRVHCSYSIGCVDNSGFGLDIHFSWLFLPFHRWYSYFLEHIMQVLLGDPTFVIHFWNWDNDGSLGPAGHGKINRCLKAGNKLPPIYADPSSPLFHVNRSWRTFVPVPSLPVDLGFNYTAEHNGPQLPDDVILSMNSQVMHDTMVINSVNSQVFFGRDYRVGDEADFLDGIGLMESTAHAGVHFWIGGDMGVSSAASKDPIFFAHHGNVDRLWVLWAQLGPGRAAPVDSDFLDAEFLFYDGNPDLVRVKVRDALDHRALGYDYEQTNDASWNYGVVTSKAHDSSYSDLLESLFTSKSQA